MIKIEGRRDLSLGNYIDNWSNSWYRHYKINFIFKMHKYEFN